MLGAFLEGMAATPFVDGASDCALTLADWVVIATGCKDPAGHLRDRYQTALGRERLLRRLGGLEAVVADCAGRAGLQRTETPVRGDVGVIRLDDRQVVAAICMGSRWAVKSNRGLSAFRTVEILSAWSVPHG